MKVLLTGAAGFLGWHTRARLHALTDHQVVPICRADWANLARHARGVEAIVHVAGINRADDDHVERGNVHLAMAVADAAHRSGGAPRIVFANSIQSGSDSAYGRGKNAASEVLKAAAVALGSAYVDVRLPNLFGEHARPQYNSFVATFVHALVNGETPQIADRAVQLLHVQDAAKLLIDGLSTSQERLDPAGTTVTVQSVFDILREFDHLYRRSDIPALLSDLDLDLFNTLRAAHFPALYPFALHPRIDDRGTLVEAVRAHGGTGQTFVSTTKSGITRGEHFHLRKCERFIVLSGQARISLRRLFTAEVASFDVHGEDPVAIDMPTMWAHNITNTGPGDLVTLFWTNELFDAEAPDTFPEHTVPTASTAVN